MISRICLRDLPTGLNYHPTGSYPNLLRHPIAVLVSTGILTCLPSTTPLGLALGSDSPSADYRCAGNLGLTAIGFFTRIIVTHVSNALGYSPRPPVSVWGTAHYYLKLRGFSWKQSFSALRVSRPSPSCLSSALRICLKSTPKHLDHHPTGGCPNFLRHPIAVIASTGILTCFPSTTPLGLALGADSPCAE